MLIRTMRTFARISSAVAVQVYGLASEFQYYSRSFLAPVTSELNTAACTNLRISKFPATGADRGPRQQGHPRLQCGLRGHKQPPGLGAGATGTPPVRPGPPR